MTGDQRGNRATRADRKSRRALTAIGAICAGLFLAIVPAAAQTAGPDYPTPPSIEYGALYTAVELGNIFPDSKTFPDLIPDAPPATIVQEYDAARTASDFSLADFVARHFTGPIPAGPTVNPAPAGTHLLDYIASLWPVLSQSETTVPAYSTLLPLPFSYVVPGGRFREVYYWDSYFTMLGLEEDGRHETAVGMLRNFAFEIDRYGHAPNGSRSYYLSRSQPPFFSLMVDLIARRDGAQIYTTFLPQLRREWEYWMTGADGLAPGAARRNLVRLPDGTLLNRYWDARAEPRDESYREDVETALASNRPPRQVWRNLRATAESGWDFSSRWLADGRTLATVRTLDVLPVDLNCLLAQLERTLAKAYLLNGDVEQALAFTQRAATRQDVIRRLMWNPQSGAFGDYLWREGAVSDGVTAVTAAPLFLGVASMYQAQVVAATIRTRLLDVGGLETTLATTGQQWDAPNGWAPLQWMAVAGLRAYGEDALAEDIATRWVRKNIVGYQQSARLVEKYNVTTTGGDAGGGGEYATQIGFGWTNGVLVALTALYPGLKAEAEAAVPALALASVP